MYKKALAQGKIDPVKFLEDGCPQVACCNLSANEVNKLVEEYAKQVLVQSHDGKLEGVDDLGRVMFTFKTTCPHCGFIQTRNNYAVELYSSGVKFCEKCCGRYFVMS
jgi:hypothetical protein